MAETTPQPCWRGADVADLPLKDASSVALWQYRDGALRPASKSAQRMVATWHDRKPVTIQVREERHAKFHRFFFAFLGMVSDAINSGPMTATSTDEVLKWLKLRLGYVKAVELPPALAKAADQSHAIEFRSISFARMDDEAFHNFATECARLVGQDLAPYIASSPQWGEVQAMIAQLRPEVAA